MGIDLVTVQKFQNAQLWTAGRMLSGADGVGMVGGAKTVRSTQLVLIQLSACVK